MKLERKIFLICLAAAPLFWLADAWLDYLFFYQGRFWELLVLDVPAHEIYIRSAGALFFILFGAFASRLAGAWRRSEEKLNRDSRIYRTALRTLRDGVVLLDAQGLVSYLNPQAEDLIGVRLEEVRGRESSELFEREVLEILLEKQAGPWSGAEPGSGWSRSGRLALVGRRGEDLTHIDFDVLGLPGKEGFNAGTVIVLKDISAYRLLEIQFDLSLALNEFQSPLESYCRILSKITEIEGVDCAGLYLVDEGSGSLDLIASEGLSAEFVEAVSHFESDAPQSEIARSGKPYYAGYIGFEGRLDEVRQREGLTALAAIPITTEGRTVALLNVAAKTHPDIPNKIKRFLEGIAGQLGQILARIKAVEAERVSEERMRLALDAVSDGLWDWDVKTSRVYFSPRYYTMLGYEPYEMPQAFETWTSLLHPDDRDKAMKVVREHLEKQEETFEVEFRLKTKDGGWRWMLGRGKTVLRAPDGSPLRMLGTHVDVQSIRDAEIELRKAEANLRRAQAVANMGSWELDLVEGTIWGSEEALKIYGLESRTSAIAVSELRKLIRDEELAAIDRAIEELLSGRGDFDLLYNLTRQNDGKLLTVHSRAELVRDDSGRPIRINGTIQDVTERAEMQAERERLIRKLEARTAELEVLTYLFSHDLKNPLVTINAYTGLVEKNLARGELSEALSDLARVSRAAEKMGLLLEEMGAVTRLSLMEISPEPVDMEEAARAAASRLSEQIESSGAAIAWDFEPDLPSIVGDRPRLTEVCYNLIENALKFGKPGAPPQLVIGGRREGGELILFVRDDGLGVDPAYQERIFGLFEQLSLGTPGAGVGLNLVARVVENHGGRVWVESQGSGLGSVFFFSLPLTAGA